MNENRKSHEIFESWFFIILLLVCRRLGGNDKSMVGTRVICLFPTVGIYSNGQYGQYTAMGSTDSTAVWVVTEEYT